MRRADRDHVVGIDLAQVPHIQGQEGAGAPADGDELHLVGAFVVCLHHCAEVAAGEPVVREVPDEDDGFQGVEGQEDGPG